MPWLGPFSLTSVFTVLTVWCCRRSGFDSVLDSGWNTSFSSFLHFPFPGFLAGTMDGEYKQEPPQDPESFASLLSGACATDGEELTGVFNNGSDLDVNFLGPLVKTVFMQNHTQMNMSECRISRVTICQSPSLRCMTWRRTLSQMLQSQLQTTIGLCLKHA